MKRLHQLLLFGALALVPAEVAAQVAPTESDPFEVLYTAEFVMQNRRAIGLNDEQRDAIGRMIQELQGRVVNLQFDQLDAVEELRDVLNAPRIDEDRALDQMERVLDVEKRIKQAHLQLLIRIKNVLNAEQQRMLDGLKKPGAGDSR